ncbi:MAG: ATP-grasp domain-containing protein [Acidobacteria bacterium]|nr:ATP-grasp domain-containing protein [Acidobacteriota bacterium]
MRVLLLATTTGYQVRSFGHAAKRLGVDIVFATDRCHRLEDPWVDRAIPIRFYDEEGSTQAILSAVATDGIAGILAVGDQPTVIAARVAEALNLPWHPAAAAAVSRNKLATRGSLRAAGMPQPWFRPVPIESSPRDLAAGIPYPCIVKPLALSASRGVIRANDPAEFIRAFDRVRALLSSTEIRATRLPDHDTMLIEGYVPGVEVAVEALMERGAVVPLALFDKPDPLEGPFFEETIYVTPSRLPAARQQAVVEAVGCAARAMGLWHGPLHAECRINNDAVVVLEIASRPIGGLCAESLRFLPPRIRAVDRTQSRSQRTAKGGSYKESGSHESPAKAGHYESGTRSARLQAGPPARSREEASPISLEELLLRHATGESVLRYRRESLASGVMMIPIATAGIFRRVEGVEEARARPHVVDIKITAKADQSIVPLPEGSTYLGFIFARAARPDAVEQALRAAHEKLRVVMDRELTVTSRA